MTNRDLRWLSAPCNKQACIEVAVAGEEVWLRDSKDPDGPILRYSPAEFSAFLEAAKTGHFDYLT